MEIDEKTLEELSDAIIDQEQNFIKVCLGWLICETSECFERNYIITMLTERMEKYETKKKALQKKYNKLGE
jgi:hypothetical protein